MTGNSESNHNPQNDKAYLQDLLLKIKQAYANQERVTFRVVEPKEKGLVAKVGGLFAFVSYRHMGWQYPTIEFWENAAPHLVGSYFTGNIHHLSEHPISIRIDAKHQDFGNPPLEMYGEYQGVVVKKAKYGVFIDLGVHFNWRFGSLLGLAHHSSLTNESDYHNWNGGDLVTTLFQGYNENGQFILGDDLERGKWLNGELDEWVGTTQKVTVSIDDTGWVEYYVLGIHQAKISLKKEYYSDAKAAKKYVNGLKNGAVIDCEIVKINKRKCYFVLKAIL